MAALALIAAAIMQFWQVAINSTDTTDQLDPVANSPLAGCIGRGHAAMFNAAGDLIGCRPLTSEQADAR